MDILLNGSGGNKRVDENRVSLPDAVGAITGLVFHGGIPPTIEVNDVVGAGESETSAGGSKREQEERRPPRRLELLHETLSLVDRCFSVQHESRCAKDILQKVMEMGHNIAVLRENEATFAGIAYLFS